MTFLSQTHRRPSRSVLSGAADLVRSFAHEIAARRAMNALADLDDATLNDIGISRGDIETAVRYGRNALRG